MLLRLRYILLNQRAAVMHPDRIHHAFVETGDLHVHRIEQGTVDTYTLLAMPAMAMAPYHAESERDIQDRTTAQTYLQAAACIFVSIRPSSSPCVAPPVPRASPSPDAGHLNPHYARRARGRSQPPLPPCLTSHHSPAYASWVHAHQTNQPSAARSPATIYSHLHHFFSSRDPS